MTQPLKQPPLPAALSLDVDADETMARLAEFTNDTMPTCGGFRFKALPPDTSLQSAPTYAVQLFGSADDLVVTYKYNYFRDKTEGRFVWRLCPLVIQWEGNSPKREAGMDDAIITHCLSSLRGFFADELRGGDIQLIMATGYLTVQRHGHAFFDRMGWTLHSYAKENDTYPALALMPLAIQKIAQRVDDISMPFRTDDIEIGTLSFAVTDIK